MKNKADNKELLITMAEREVKEWTEVREEAEIEIEEWEMFIDKLEEEK